MTLIVILTISFLLLIAYIFDLTSHKTKVPSVILLLLLGWGVKQLTVWFSVQIPNLSPVLPVLGTIGLILIVLEGSLELELNNSKLGLIRKSFFGALIPMLAMAFLFAFVFMYFGNFGFKNSLVNAIPFCVISSAIAIPSVRNLSNYNQEFVIYESSLSDILGVLIFNFLVLNETISLVSFGNFAIQLLIIMVVSFIATIGLSILLNKIEHHVKFVPIILLVFLIYAVAKIYHLPSLIFILLFGLFLENFNKIKCFKWMEKFRPDELDKEVKKFKELIIEVTFLIRALFFLLFGYLIETSEIFNEETFIWAVGIVLTILIIRSVQLKLSKLPFRPLLFLAPRGLITILLYLSVVETQRISIVNKSLIIQVIVLTALLMMIGLMTSKRKKRQLISLRKTTTVKS